MRLPVFQFVLLLCSAAAIRAAEEPMRFSLDILPILSDNCFHCHGPDEKGRKASLRLDTLEGATGGKNPAIHPGDPAGSEFVRRITATDPDDLMPPSDSNRKLTPRQIELLKQWIKQGAPWGRHWAYEPLTTPRPPEVKNSKWPRNPIDRFILARLEMEGLAPSPEATRRQLIRRVALDLTGLPPSPEEVDAFVKDDSPRAYEKLVDRLLASWRYGERMAWDWLDAARYADTNGYQGDPTRTMWPWRDWVIASLNKNQPYDQFTIEQLAGDLLPGATLEQKIASGFNRNHMFNGEGGRIADETRVENVMDRVETTATIWMGATFTCCRCHDHKYDPFTLKDYFGLYDFFNQMSETGEIRGGQAEPVVDVSTPEQREKLARIQASLNRQQKEILEMEKALFPKKEDGAFEDTPLLQKIPGNSTAALKSPPLKRYLPSFEESFKFLEDDAPDYVAAGREFLKTVVQREQAQLKVAKVMVMDQIKKPRDTFILTKGAYDKPTDAKVTASVPAMFGAIPEGAEKNRLALAQWLVSSQNPLAARVTVNRYWQMLFGMGIVKSVEDFGVQGEKPSHPQLIDWLAGRYVAGGWDTKALLRTIVTSAAYRQSSKTNPSLTERDPDNRLLARGPRFRMPSWMLRDQALAVSGLLVDKIGGPSVRPYQPEGIWEEATFGKITYKQDHGQSLYRRSLYIFWRRIVGPTMFFDAAARQVCTIKAIRTNSPLHALVTMNDTTYVEAARALAQRVMLAESTDEARADLAFKLATARLPSQSERSILLHRLQSLGSQYAQKPQEAAKLLAVGESPRDPKLDAAKHAAWTGVCLTILNMDEVLTKQ